MKSNRLVFHSAIFMLLIFVMYACSKTDNGSEIIPLTSGSLTGNVKLVDKFGKSSSKFDDVKIEIIDKNKNSYLVYPGVTGRFYMDDLDFGEFDLVIEKPKYAGLQTIKFKHSKDLDTLATLTLSEELPFAYKSLSITYDGSVFQCSNSIDYVSSESYMVGNIFCFSKKPDVSINSCDILFPTSSFTDAKNMGSTFVSGVSFSKQNFIDKGYAVGDLVYVVNYPVAMNVGGLLNTQKQDFNITSYKFTNPSPVSSFILK